jgi:hypothetical protein
MSAILEKIEPEVAERYCALNKGNSKPSAEFEACASLDSIAISLKRIADALWGNETCDGGTTGIIQLLNGIEQNGRKF